MATPLDPPDAPGPPAAPGTDLAADDRLYDPGYLRALFDEMAGSYERVNFITSFGFSERWRRHAVDRLELMPGAVVLDWMTGMGEGWGRILRRIGPQGRLVATDLSPGMLGHAASRLERWRGHAIEVVEGDVLDNPTPSGSVDAVLCLFGVKTLSPSQRRRFAEELARVLRPGGRFSIIEVSVPPRRILRWPYGLYLRRVIPILGRLLLGDPETYRMLGVYTDRYGDSTALLADLRATGLEAHPVSEFFGCATGARGRRPG